MSDPQDVPLSTSAGWCRFYFSSLSPSGTTHLGEHNFVGAWPRPVDEPISDFYPEPKMNNYSFPTRSECSHSHSAEYQAAKESAYAYDALYTNINGVRDSWASMWSVVAARFQGRSEVLGYELLNEPFMGDFYRDPIIAVPYPNPYNADAKMLQPAYDRLSESIRERDNETLVFFAGVTWDDAGPGFTAPPGGEEYADRSVLAFHYYEPPQVSTTGQIDVQIRGAARLNTGVFLTETAGGVKQVFGEDNKLIYEAADDKLVSWSYWEYKTYCRESNETLDSDSQQGVWGSCHGFIQAKEGQADGQAVGQETGNHQDDQKRERTRTYAEAVAGVTNSMRFDAVDSTFTLEYVMDGGIDMPTEIRINKEVNYPNGFDVDLMWSGLDELKWEWDEENEPFVLYIRKGKGEGREGSNGDVKVTIKAK